MVSACYLAVRKMPPSLADWLARRARFAQSKRGTRAAKNPMAGSRLPGTGAGSEICRTRMEALGSVEAAAEMVVREKNQNHASTEAAASRTAEEGTNPALNAGRASKQPLPSPAGLGSG